MALDNSRQPHAGVGMFVVPISYVVQKTADDTSGPTVTIPVACRIVHAVGYVEAVGGTTVATDVDLVVKNVTQSTTICTLAAVDGSAIVAAGGTASPTSNDGVNAADVIEVEIDVTGGASPTIDGVHVLLYCVRE